MQSADDIEFDNTRHNQNVETAVALNLVDHVKSHQTYGKDWPADAVYALVYRLSTWPVGEDKDDTVAFFANAGELQTKVRELDEWAQLEDNNWRLVDLYMWDLGPVLIVQDRETHLYGSPTL